MSFKIEVTDVAAKDILDIKHFVEAVTGPGSADQRLENLAYTIGQLATVPFGGAVIPELAALGIMDIRRKPSNSDHVVYKVDEKNEKVTVVSVYPHKKDFQSILLRRMLRI